MHEAAASLTTKNMDGGCFCQFETGKMVLVNNHTRNAKAPDLAEKKASFHATVAGYSISAK